jgi:hypothetical protein
MPFRPCRHTVSRLTPKVLAAALTDPPLEPRLVLRNPEVTRGSGLFCSLLALVSTLRALPFTRFALGIRFSTPC